MLNIHGSTVAGGAIAPFGAYAGYLVLHSGHIWIGVLFMVITAAYLALSLATISRYIINSRRSRQGQSS